MRARPAGWRRTAFVTGGVVLLTLALLLGVVAAAVGFLGSAALTSRVSLLCVAGLASGLVVATALAWLAGGLLGAVRRGRLALGVGVGIAALVALASAVTVFRPLVPAADVDRVETPPEARFWDLPTGSRIAYRRIPAGSSEVKRPVVFLHGGPGAGVVSTPEVAEAFSFLTETGHDVYLYDQVGGGRSNRLADPRDYTIERHVEDLEAIRQTLQAESIVLIGESWGAELASHYIAAHPERVARCVLVSPGPLHPKDWGETEPCDLRGQAPPEKRRQLDRLLLRAAPRLVTARLLLEVNPRAVGAFLPNAEADAFARRVFSLLLEKMVGSPTHLPANAHFDFGLWGNVMTDEDIDSQTTRIDERLAAYPRPVLILRGDRDYCVPEIASQYAGLFPDATLALIEGAGHIIWLDKPAEFARTVRSFLAEGPVADQP
jgi:pimeloyl-ACP methyl ester carboxylesterase